MVPGCVIAIGHLCNEKWVDWGMQVSEFRSINDEQLLSNFKNFGLKAFLNSGLRAK
jgi:hypothetical protein